MDYKLIYDAIILRAKGRKLYGDVYYEQHHIIPKCMGGSDDTYNLVHLTGREHYIAHLLLAKIYPTNSKIIFAANMMCNRNNRHYDWVRRQFSIAIKQYNLGYRHTENARKKMSISRKNKVKKDTHKRNISEAHKQDILYQNNIYRGYADLEEKTGITPYLYKKYYMNGIDPTPYIKNHTHGIRSIDRSKIQPALGKKWVNNGIIERYTSNLEPGWYMGRLKKK